jgi:hypothetical protein
VTRGSYNVEPGPRQAYGGSTPYGLTQVTAAILAASDDALADAGRGQEARTARPDELQVAKLFL